MRANDRLYTQIKGGIYHSTSVTGYRGIRSSGAIQPNTGLFPSSHFKSQYSCCRKLGAISLLDLQNPTRPLVGRKRWSNWTTFLDNHRPITVLLDIDPAYLSEQLHDFDSLREHDPDCTMVAEAEKCYSRPIPINAVRRCILVCAKSYSFFQIISGHTISDTDFAQTEANFEAKLRKIGYTEPPDVSRLFDKTSPNTN